MGGEAEAAPFTLVGTAAEPGRKPVGLRWGFTVVPLWVLDGPTSSTQRRVCSTSPTAVDGGKIGGCISGTLRLIKRKDHTVFVCFTAKFNIYFLKNRQKWLT